MSPMVPIRSLLVLVANLVTSQAINFQSRRAPYYWPHARGNPSQYSTTNVVMPPGKLNASFAWSWHHPGGRYHTVVTSAGLIDDKKNIYLASEEGVRKFSPDGQELWYYKSEVAIPTCPSLMDGALFGNNMAGIVFALDMETGKELWVKQAGNGAPGDTAYVESYHGMVFTGVNPGPGGGATTVVALDAKTGDNVWEFHTDSENVLWNFMPLETPDDSLIFMNMHGGVYKVGLHNGTFHWYSSPPEKSAQTSFSDGGVMVGPDGTSYTCSNYEGSGQEGELGAVRAFALQDGHMLWEHVIDKPCNSWPVVSSDGATVIVPGGSFVDSPSASKTGWWSFIMSPEKVHDLSLALGTKELETFGKANKRATVWAFNAKTGTPQWSKDLPAYGRVAAAGDEEGYLERKALKHRDQCLPAQFGAPTMSGDGTVYVGRADGNLYAVRPEGKEVIVDTFQTGAGFLHPGPSFAPGMMAVTSCDGLFVWKF